MIPDAIHAFWPGLGLKADPGEGTMSPPKAAYAVLFLVLILASLIAPRHANAEELRYGRWSEFCPFTCFFKEHGQHGLVIDILMEVAAMNGMTYRTVKVPAKRKFSALNTDITNVATVWSTNQKALASVVPAKEAIVAVRWATASKKDYDFQFRKLEDLKRVKLIMADGTDLSPEFMDYLKTGAASGRVQLLYGKDFGKRGLNMLLKDRGDVYLTGMIPLGFRIKKFGFGDRIKVTHAPYFPTAYIYPSFSKNNPRAQAYADMMTKGSRQLRKSGRLATILDAYGLTDWADRK
ncbi:MAG: hypothetical protein QF521_23255 [Alphaproteobacteria bacterium]|nr:hypothetical protein [Alphaproteobacteria bacterium]